MEGQQVFIHIGMPRSASTFLQREVFSKLPDYQFKDLDDTYYSKGFNQLQFADDSFYDQQAIEELVAGWTAEKLILSNENFIGQSVYFNHANRSMIAKRLKEIYPNASIVLILRNQIDLLASMYTINLQGKQVGAIDDFVWFPKDANLRKIWGQGDSYFNTTAGYECLDGYDYNSLIALYNSLFDKVNVLLFEELIANPSQFASRLSTTLGTAVDPLLELIEAGESKNSSVTERQAKRLLKLNKYQELFDRETIAGRGLQYMKRRVINKETKGDKPAFSEEKRKVLEAHFGPLNKQLAQQYPELGLEKYSSEYYMD